MVFYYFYEKKVCQGAYKHKKTIFDDFLSYVFSKGGFQGAFQVQVYLVGIGLVMDGYQTRRRHIFGGFYLLLYV